ncbi:hypothetical protein BGZ80_011129, partial [Entomortierella chlamydospora]
MTKQKKTPQWYPGTLNLPNAQYFLSAKDPRDFDYVAYLTFIKPSSRQLRDVTSEWLKTVIPTLKNSPCQELREAGNRLTTEWTSKKASRDAFWENLAKAEEREQEKLDRMKRLKSAGEQRLRAAEDYLVEETKQDFELETKLYKAASSSTQVLPVSQHESSASSSSSSSLNVPSVTPSDSTSSLTDILDSTLTTNAMSNSIPNMVESRSASNNAATSSRKRKMSKSSVISEDCWHDLYVSLSKL